MASRLLRDPRRGRCWHRPQRTAIPAGVSATRLAARLYSPRGPKHGLQPRRDVIEKRAILNDYLRRRARVEQSGQWASTVGEVAAGVLQAMARLSAKPWDAAIGRGQPRLPRHEALRHHYATVIATLLDDLQTVGVLRWGGVRDNNGLWWRLEIELLDPDTWSPAEPTDDGGEGSGPTDTIKPQESPNDDAEAPSAAGTPPALEGSPLASISRDSEDLSRSAFGAYTNVNTTTSVIESQTFAVATGARLDDRAATSIATGGSGQPVADERRGQGGGVAAGFDPEVLLARVRERERARAAGEEPAGRYELELASRQRGLETVRNWPRDRALPAGLLREAFTTLTSRDGVLTPEDRGRLERARRRYDHYATSRADGWPAASAAAVLHTIEHVRIGGEAIATLRGAISHFDIRSKQMARAHKQHHADAYLRAAVRRARQRAERAEPTPRIAFRRGDAPASLEDLECAYHHRRDPQAVRQLLGRLRGAEDLRLELRDRNLLTHGHPRGYDNTLLAATPLARH